MDEKENFEKWLCAKAGLTFSDCVQKYSNEFSPFDDLLDYKTFFDKESRKLLYRNNDYIINLVGGQTYLLNYNRYAFRGKYCEKIFVQEPFYFQYDSVKEIVLTFQEMKDGKWLEDNKLQFTLAVVKSSYTAGLQVCDYKSFFDCTFMAKLNGEMIGMQHFRLGVAFLDGECKRSFDNINCLALVDSFLKEGLLKRLYDKFIKRNVALPEPLFNLNIDNEIKEVREKQQAKKVAEKREKRLNRLKLFLFLPWSFCKLLWLICKLPWLAVKGIYNAYCRWQAQVQKEKTKKAKWFE